MLELRSHFLPLHYSIVVRVIVAFLHSVNNADLL